MLKSIQNLWKNALDDLLMEKAEEISGFLELKYPVIIAYTTDDKYMGGHYDGMKITKKGKIKCFHEILISVPHHKTYLDYVDTLAHELIHAWQWENGFKRNHKRIFHNMVETLKLEFNVNAGMAS